MSHNRFLENFKAISAIPRCSGNEGKIADFLEAKAKELGCQTKRDAIGNLIIKKEADSGFENRKIITLQGHMDMVCEKEAGCSHDFSCDPLTLKEFSIKNANGEVEPWLTAEGTSLGADNGFALAAGMSLLEDPDFFCGPLELLFTVDEEEGLKGALNLDGSLIEGRLLINLDSEDEGEFTIGCAGGQTMNLSFPPNLFLTESAKEKQVCYQIEITGLPGGHSGVEIHRVKANAIKELVSILVQLNTDEDFNLIEFNASFRHNVIPSSAQAQFASSLPLETLQSRLAPLLSQLQIDSPNAKVTLSIVPKKEKILFNHKATDRFLEWAKQLPFGPFSFVAGNENLVESSANCAQLIFNQAEGVLGSVSFRSSNGEKLKQLISRYTKETEKAGGLVQCDSGYPSWQPDFESDLLKKAVSVWEKRTQKTPKISVIHAGLECGLIGEKLPGCEMISIGPDIVDVHSPKEKMNLASAIRVYDYLKELILSDLSKP